jgi:UDP-N-acetylglucosamine 2-epimerase
VDESILPADLSEAIRVARKFLSVVGTRPHFATAAALSRLARDTAVAVSLHLRAIDSVGHLDRVMLEQHAWLIATELVPPFAAARVYRKLRRMISSFLRPRATPALYGAGDAARRIARALRSR